MPQCLGSLAETLYRSMPDHLTTEIASDSNSWADQLTFRKLIYRQPQQAQVWHLSSSDSRQQQRVSIDIQAAAQLHQQCAQIVVVLGSDETTAILVTAQHKSDRHCLELSLSSGDVLVVNQAWEFMFSVPSTQNLVSGLVIVQLVGRMS